MRPTRSLLEVALAGILGLLLLSSGACSEPPKPAYPPRVRTAGTAVLPPAPNLHPERAPARYDDGTWSVRGVIEAGARLPSQGVRVRGFVAALHACPDPARRCNPAPFVQLTDAENLQGRRLLVGGPIDPERDGLKVGKPATIAGRFATRSADGLYFAPGGMLLFSPPLEEPGQAEPGGGAKSGRRARSL